MNTNNTKETTRVKTKGYSFAKKRAKLNQKKVEAIARNAAWNKLTNQEKIASLKNRRGESKKQLAKLENLNK